VVAIDSISFKRTIEPLLPSLKAYCFKLTGSKADAEDLLQVTLMKAYCSINFETVRLKKAYLLRIAKHVWIDEHRKRVVRQVQRESDRMDSYIYVDFDVREAMEVMADQLSVRQMVLVLLMDVFGFTAKETAVFLASTEGAVKEGVRRARSRLRGLMSEPHACERRNRECRELERMTPELLDTFVSAFRSGNIHNIHIAYRTSCDRGAEAVEVWVREESKELIYFELRDPSGHLLRVTS